MEIIRTIKYRSPVGVLVELQQRQYPGASRPHWIGLRDGVVATNTSDCPHEPLLELFPQPDQAFDRRWFEMAIVGPAIEDE